MIIEYNCVVGRSARELSWKRDARKKNGTTQRCGSNLSNFVFVVDTAVMQGVKKFFNMQQVILCHQTQTKDRIKSRTKVKSHFFRQEDEKLVDPYVLFQFCGKEVLYMFLCVCHNLIRVTFLHGNNAGSQGSFRLCPWWETTFKKWLSKPIPVVLTTSKNNLKAGTTACCKCKRCDCNNNDNSLNNSNNNDSINKKQQQQ